MSQTRPERVTVDHDVPISMRDGVTLIGDIYRPADGTGHPALVHRTPYDRTTNPSMMLDPIEAANRGYVVLTQDVRGRFASEGDTDFFRHEADDGYDTIEWTARQPWCTGEVGIFGRSAMGLTCLQAVGAGPPSLKAAFATHAGANLYDGFIYSGGVFELGWCMRLMLKSGFAADTVARLDTTASDRQGRVELVSKAQGSPWESLSYLPLRDFPPFANGSAPYWKIWLDHPTYDSFWASQDMTMKAASITIPVLHLSSWYDIFLSSHIALQHELEKISDEEIRQRHHFVLGPWDHPAFSHNPTCAGDRDFGASADAYEITRKLLFDWFDYWLCGKSSLALIDRPRVRYFMTGANEWRDERAWPPPSTRVSCYLRSNGRANSSAGDGVLSFDPAQSEPPDVFVYDPMSPVPSVGGRTLHNEILPGGVVDQREVETRDDVLVYTSTPLESDFAIAGAVQFVLFASSDAPDTDFTAKLVDVEPDGYCANIAEGIARARNCRPADQENPWLSPGQIESYTIDLCAVAHVFLREHCIRVEISSSNFPRFERNLNSSVVPSAGGPEDVRVARQSVWHDIAHPSAVSLPAVTSSTQD